MDVVNEIRKSIGLSTLGLVCGKREISTKRMNLAEAIEKGGARIGGNINYEAESDWYRKNSCAGICRIKFFKLLQPENHAYSYELEYLIGGGHEEERRI